MVYNMCILRNVIIALTHNDAMWPVSTAIAGHTQSLEGVSDVLSRGGDKERIRISVGG